MITHEQIQHYLQQLVDILKLEKWDISYSIVDYTMNEESKARNKVDYSYLNAEITIDRDKISNEDDLLDTLIHELLHLFQSPFFRFIDLVESSIMQNAQLQSVLLMAWHDSLEENNVMMCRLVTNGIKEQLLPFKPKKKTSKRKKK